MKLKSAASLIVALCVEGIQASRLRYNPASEGAFMQVNGILDAIKRSPRGTVGNAVSDVLTIALPESCLGQRMMAGFSRFDDYPYMPACAAGNSATELTCFGPETTVLTPSGKRPLATINEGDLIHTGNAFEEVLFFLHKGMVPASGTLWVTIHAGSSAVSVTAPHLIHVCSRAPVSVADCTNVVPASQIGRGHIVAVRRGLTSQWKFEKVDSVLHEWESTPVYAPVTKSGRVLANGVLASAFSAPGALPISWAKALGAVGASLPPSMAVAIARFLEPTLATLLFSMRLLPFFK